MTGDVATDATPNGGYRDHYGICQSYAQFYFISKYSFIKDLPLNQFTTISKMMSFYLINVCTW